MPFTAAQKKEWGKKKGWKCDKCGRAWYQGWLLEFHHRVPSSLGGKDIEENAELLCLGCHLGKHRSIEETARISSNLIEGRLKKTKGRWK